MKKHVRAQHLEETKPEAADRSRRSSTLYSIPLDDTPRRSKMKRCSTEEADKPPSTPESPSKPVKTTQSNMSEEWLCCTRCDYVRLLLFLNKYCLSGFCFSYGLIEIPPSGFLQDSRGTGTRG